MVKTVDGGRLMADADPRTIGPENCIQRLNIRREDDAEMLFPGWVYYGNVPADCIHFFRAARPNGERAALAFTATGIYKYNPVTLAWDELASGFTSTTEWEAVNIDGYVVFNNGIDLPHIWDWDNPVEPIHELREQGIIRVGTIFTAFNFLCMADITEFSPEALAAWMAGADPYGNVTTTVGATRTQYRLIWTDKPKEWGLNVEVYVRGGGSKEIVLPFPVVSLKAGDTINYIETVEDDDLITVQLTEEEIESVSGNRVYLMNPVDTESRGMLTRSNYSERILGYDDLQGDGSRIMKGEVLGSLIFLMRESAILLGQVSTDASQPFIFEEVYRGLASPTSKRLITTVGSNAIFYYSRDGWFEFNLQVQRPQRLRTFDFNNSLLAGVTEDSSFAFDMTADEELWICLPDRTVIYDYANQIVSELDAVFHAAGLVDDPGDLVGGADRLLLLAQDSLVFKLDGSTFTRAGQSYDGILKYGWVGDSGKMRDILFRRYIPMGLEGSVLLTLDKARSGSADLNNVITDVPVRLGKAVQLYARSEWIQETITIQDGSVRLIGREMDYFTTEDRVRGYGVT